MPAFGIPFMECDLKRRIAAEQFVGAFAAQRHAETVSVHPFGNGKRAYRTANKVRLNRLADFDRAIDLIEHIIAVGIELDSPQIKAGSIRVLRGVSVIRAIDIADEIAGGI
jgi:hypothetical protein